MDRVAIIVDKSLNNGEVANVAAILMGQLAVNYLPVYSNECIIDKSGFQHSGIMCNTIVLKTNKTKLMKFCTSISDGDYQKQIITIIFTREGQSLNNRFEEYMRIIKSNSLFDLHPVGVALAGKEHIIRNLTSKFSLY
jgi:hypothetical protein|nr:DUF2000 family protein [uncultured Acetatifactor sp.]